MIALLLASVSLLAVSYGAHFLGVDAGDWLGDAFGPPSAARAEADAAGPLCELTQCEIVGPRLDLSGVCAAQSPLSDSGSVIGTVDRADDDAARDARHGARATGGRDHRSRTRSGRRSRDIRRAVG